MKTSDNGLNIIKKYEGCRLEAYRCPAGVWTIGYGHTKGVKEGEVITKELADKYLRKDVERAEKHVESFNSKYNWTQNEFDAMVSFAFNLGSINQLTANGTRSKEIIANKIPLYRKAGGKVLKGLVKRRAEERELFIRDGLNTSKSESNIKQYSLVRDGDMKLSENFKVKEFRCHDGTDKILIDDKFVREKLQAIRDHFKVPVRINSAYRTEDYNRRIGGAKRSYHLLGRAFDIYIPGYKPEEVAKYAYKIGVTGIIQYNTFVHIDSRDNRYYARNNNGKVKKLSKF